MLSVASVKTNTGIEIQNCASNTGRRFGMTYHKMILHWLQPLDLASNRKSESRMLFDAAETTRKEEGQPSTPNKANVATTEMIGERSIGSTARSASSTNSSGSAIDRSAAANTARSHHPPVNPAMLPKRPAISVDKSAAAGARSKETRVP